MNTLSVKINAFRALIILFFYCAELAQFTTQVSAQTWNWSNMNGPWRANRVRQLAAAYDNSNTLFLYAADSGSTLIKYDEAQETWTHLSAITNPSVVACKNDTPSIVLANVGSQLKRSTNSGGIWTTVLSGISQLVPRTLVAAPKEADPKRIFLGTEKMTDNSSLWKSEDGGKSFSEDSSFRFMYHTNITAVFFDPLDTNNIYVGGSGIVNGEFIPVDETQSLDAAADSNGFWKSTDGGTTWAQNSSKLKGKNVTAIAQAKDISNNDILLAGVSNRISGNAVVYHSNNAGGNWSNNVATLGSADIIYAIQVDPVTKQNVYVSTDKGIYYSTDGGYNFNKAVKNLFDRNVLSFTAARKNNTVKYFAGTSSAIFTGNHSHWTDISTGISIGNSTTFFVDYNTVVSASNTFSGTSVYENDKWKNYAVTTEGQFFADKLLPEGYILGRMLSMSGTQKRTMIFQSANTGSDWDSLLWDDYKNTSDTLYCIAENGFGDIFAGGYYHNGDFAHFNFLYYDEAAEVWKKSKIHNNASVVVSLTADIEDAGILYASLLGEGVWKRVWNSATDEWVWNPVLNSTATIRTIAIHYSATTKTIYAAGDNTIMYKSTDEGANWSNINVPAFFSQIIFHPSYESQNFIWALSSDGYHIYSTTNGGTNWSEVNTTSLPKIMNDLQFDQYDYSYIYVGTPGGIYRIDQPPLAPKNLQWDTDNPNSSVHPCLSWDGSPEIDLPTLKYKVFKKRGQNGNWYEKATISGTTYTDNSEELLTNEDPLRIYYYVKTIDDGGNLSLPSNTISFICNNGVGEQKIRTGNLRELPKEFALSQNYPNPFNPTTTIVFALPVDATVTLKIFDIAGKEIATLVKGFREAGYYEASFDAKKLASGMYIFRLDATGADGKHFTEKKKMIVMK